MQLSQFLCMILSRPLVAIYLYTIYRSRFGSSPISATMAALVFWLPMAGPLLTIYAGVAAGTQELWLVGIVPYSSGEWDTGISVAAGGQLMADNINANPPPLPGYDSFPYTHLTLPTSHPF